MKFDFTTIMDRKGKDALAVDKIPYKDVQVQEGFSVLPMWVADMNFATVPSVQKVMTDRIAHPAFGYFEPREEYFDAIIRWHAKRNGVQGLTRECIGYENGVLGGVLSALNVFCSRGDKVLVHSPTYIGFTFSLKNNGYEIVHSPLVLDENGVWRMDYEDMEKKICENHIHAAIFCSPHNPCGRVWERWEIERAMELYRKYDCVVVSDEIWSDLILPGHRHVPTQSVSDDARRRTVALYAPSKTFSLAGLIGSYHIIYNTYLRDRVVRQSEVSHYNDCNVLSLHALLGAYSPAGEEWADEMCCVIDANHEYACNFIRDNFKGVRVMRPEGTYMLYLDCADWCRKHGVTIRELQERGIRAGVIWQDGEAFMLKDTIRMNLALPHSLLEEAMQRLKEKAFV